MRRSAAKKVWAMADLDVDGKIFVGKSGKPEYLTLISPIGMVS
jgi:hypothetical protein